jgi:hypothetical protein
MLNCGPGAKKNEDEDTDDDANESSWALEYVDKYFVFNWRRVTADPRFTYKNANWRRMLPIQPPKRTVWTIYRGKLRTP